MQLQRARVLEIIIVQQIRAKFYKNCGVYGKSTKICPVIVYDMVNNIGYGPHRDLSHNSKYSRFNFLHRDSSMETRLSQTIPNLLSIYACKTVKPPKLKKKCKQNVSVGLKTVT